MQQHELIELRRRMRDVHDFPKPGIVYRDITPIPADANAFNLSIRSMARSIRKYAADEILGTESRGFVFGAALSHHLKLPFHVFRKPGKLPPETVTGQYSLEYGEDGLELLADAIRPHARYAIVDDVIATGGTAGAACRLVRRCGGNIAC